MIIRLICNYKKQSSEDLFEKGGGTILAEGNLCFRVFKLQLKENNKNVSYLYSVWVNQIN